MSFIIQEIPTPTVFGIGVVEPTGAGGAISFEVGTQDQLFFEGNASANFTVDVIFDPTTSLNVAMQDEDVATIHLKVKNGLTPYALEALTIDGTGSGIEIFFGGSEFFPILGATSQVYDYAFEITKISNANFQVFVGINSDYSEGLNPPAPAFGVSAADSGTGSGATVTFTAGDLGGASAATFTVISNPSAITATGSASPITINGLTILGTYDFTVKTTTIAGQSTSSPSNQITLAAAPGQQAYTATGSYSFIAPAGINSISVVAVGPGGAGAGSYYNSGGGGGGLGYKNNITVTPLQSYTVKVNQALGPATGSGFFDASSTLIVAGYTGTAGSGAGSSPPRATSLPAGQGGSYLGDGGGTGGPGGNAYYEFSTQFLSGGGGGAAGYAGNGGTGGYVTSGPTGVPATSGSGGGGGGGAGGTPSNNFGSAGGGGVGLLGQGSNGSGGAVTPTPGGSTAFGGGGGSGGANGTNRLNSGNQPGGAGGAYGGGGGGGANAGGGAGGSGAVRIIYPGTTRQFPSTNTGDL